MMFDGTPQAIKEFSLRKSKSLSDGAIREITNSVALDGLYNVEMQVHTFPFEDYAVFNFQLTHKDEEYSMHSRSARGSGIYFLPFNPN